MCVCVCVCMCVHVCACVCMVCVCVYEVCACVYIQYICACVYASILTLVTPCCCLFFLAIPSIYPPSVNSTPTPTSFSHSGAPLIIHPGRDPKSPLEILEILSQEGADISHTVMSHLDRTVSTEHDLLEVARRGCYLEYDLFGVECSHYQVSMTSLG